MNFSEQSNNQFSQNIIYDLIVGDFGHFDRGHFDWGYFQEKSYADPSQRDPWFDGVLLTRVHFKILFGQNVEKNLGSFWLGSP